MPADPLLAVDGLTVALDGVDQPLIDGIDLAVGPGETLCIVGESGCGKSMTALAIMGLLPRGVARVTAGACRFEGRDLLALPPPPCATCAATGSR
jgi:peptide/nickel transport system ATP-binding protein